MPRISTDYQQALIDDIVNSVNILSFKATNAVEKGLLGANPSDLGFKIPPQTTPEAQEQAVQISEQVKHEIENGVHQLETLLEAKIDKNFDRLEIYALRNILSVPAEVRDWVRLAHYEGLSFGDTAGGAEEPNTESVTLLRKKVRETQKLHTLLLQERARNEATIRGLKTLMGAQGTTKKEGDKEEEGTYPVFKFLGDKGGLKGDVNHPVTTTAEFALSQVEALKSLLVDVEPRLNELAEGGDGEKGKMVGIEEKSFRRERLEFIEKETRKHLENVRGLELGEMGEIRDGEWQGDGRKLGKGEVEDLEKVIGMVDDGDGDGEPMDQS